jgi:phosphate-selective porin OprO and OprP
MFNYLHGDIAKQVSATNVGDDGAKFDALGVRTPIAF